MKKYNHDGTYSNSIVDTVSVSNERPDTVAHLKVLGPHPVSDSVDSHKGLIAELR